MKLELWIRSVNPYAYHAGKWAKVTAVSSVDLLGEVRPVFVIEFPNGDTDQWPIYDPAGQYEFAREAQ